MKSPTTSSRAVSSVMMILYFSRNSGTMPIRLMILLQGSNRQPLMTSPHRRSLMTNPYRQLMMMSPCHRSLDIHILKTNLTTPHIVNLERIPNMLTIIIFF
jgi:hypothetical protein